MSIVTPELLLHVGCTPEIASRWSAHMNAAIEVGGLRSKLDQAAFLATCLHESKRFTSMAESMNYAAAVLPEKFSGRFTPELAKQYGRRPSHPANQIQIAIIAYGGWMENDPAPSRDGWDFRGQGPIQITGKRNVRLFQAWLKARGHDVDVLKNPALLQHAEIGSLAAAWFWSSNKLSRFGEAGKFLECSAVVNTGRSTTPASGINGWADRLRYYDKIKAYLGLS